MPPKGSCQHKACLIPFLNPWIVMLFINVFLSIREIHKYIYLRQAYELYLGKNTQLPTKFTDESSGQNCLSQEQHRCFHQTQVYPS